MNVYGGFAYMYDLLMADIPYESWAAYIDSALLRHFNGKCQGRIVLDLACGTGNITLPLARLGYDMIGVDISTDMLAQAQAKLAGEPVLFLAQDMRRLDLYGTVDAAICTCDGLNYILEEAELAAVFKRVRMFLNPGGIFIFDMNTRYKFDKLLGGKSFTGEAGGASFVWDNHFDPATGINEYQVEFTPAAGQPFVEVHRQRAYPTDFVCELLQAAGFSTVAVRDGYSENAPGDDCSRVVFVAV